MDTIIEFYAKTLMKDVTPEKIDEYLALVNSLPEQKPSNHLYTEQHHIIPRFLCKRHSFLIRIPANRKRLLISDHIQAHEKLMEIFPCLSTKTAYLMLVRTCKRLCFNIDKVTLEKYNITREWLRNNTPWKNGPSNEQKEKSRKAHIENHIGKGSRLYHKGDTEIRAQTQQEWDKLENEGWVRGRSAKNRECVIEGVRKKCSGFRGTVLLRKDNEMIRVSVNEAKKLRKEGWVSVNHSLRSTRGTTYVTNEIITKRIENIELPNYIAIGWRQGLHRKL
jgi:hypothetical protein